MLVIAVGANSVSGKIRATVYGEDEDEEGSPLFQKLDVRRVAPPAPIRRRSHRPAAPPSLPSPSLPISLPSPPPLPVILPLPPPPPPSFAFRTASYHPGHRAHLATLLRRSPPSCPTPSLSSLLFAGPISPPLRRRRFRARSPPTPQVLVVQIGKFGGVTAGVCVIADVRHRLPLHQCRCRRQTKVGSESPLPSTPLFHPSR